MFLGGFINLEIIEEKFDSELHNLKIFKKGSLLFKNNDLLYSGNWNSNLLKVGFLLIILIFKL